MATSVQQPPQQIFLENLALIEGIVRQICRRHLCRPDEGEEFAAIVKLKLIEDDYSVLRSYEGRSSLRTFLTVAIQRLYLDHLNHLWGKWRPCEAAKRLGKTAEKLDQLLNRDGYTLHEACEILLTSHRAEVSRERLEEIAALLPSRAPRRREGEETLLSLAAPDPAPDAQLMAAEREKTRYTLLEELKEALASLPAEDRLILRLRFEEGIAVATIARSQCLEAKGLYRRIERLEKTLRDQLTRRGITWDQVWAVLGRTGPRGPSKR